jgi:hypothetical protein
MNANLKIRMTQLAGLLLLAAWWMTSAQPASARPLPPGDPTTVGLTATGSASAPFPAAPIVVHDHLSVWAYLLVAAIAVAATLVAVLAVRAIRRASSGRAAKQLRPA